MGQVLGLRISCGFQGHSKVVVTGFLLPPGKTQRQSPEACNYNDSEVPSGPSYQPWSAFTPVIPVSSCAEHVLRVHIACLLLGNREVSEAGIVLVLQVSTHH